MLTKWLHSLINALISILKPFLIALFLLLKKQFYARYQPPYRPRYTGA